MEEKKQNNDFAICSTLFPISNMILVLSGAVESNVCHKEDYQDCFMLAVSNPRAFWKDRLSPEEYEIYLKRKEFDLINEDFEDLNEELYLTDEEYRQVTLNIIFEERVNALKNL
jgi:hypothetical protein